MQQTLQYFGINLSRSTIFCDNISDIYLSKNPINHSWAKNIDICHHFLRVNIEKDIVKLEFVSSENLPADIFIKPLKESIFIKLRRELGILSLKIYNNFSILFKIFLKKKSKKWS